MAESELGAVGEIIFAESLALGVTAETLSTAGATIPQNTGDITVVVPSGDNIRWTTANLTPTASVGRRIPASHARRIPMTAIVDGAKFISEDAADVTCILIYHRGASRSDAAYSLTDPH